MSEEEKAAKAVEASGAAEAVEPATAAVPEAPATEEAERAAQPEGESTADGAANGRPEKDAEDSAADEGCAPAAEAEEEPKSEPKPRPKPKRPVNKKLIIGVLVAAIVVLAALVAFFTWSSGIDDQLKEQAEAEVADSGLVEAVVIPSSWQDQTGFEADKITAKSVERDPFSATGPAVVNVEATAENGCYRAFVDYALSYEQQDGQWVLLDVDRGVGNYFPVSSIPDDAVLANVDAILAAVDAHDAEIGYKRPRTMVDFFGQDTVASIGSNNFIANAGDVALLLARTYDGVPYEGQIDVNFEWDKGNPEGGDWKIGSVEATEATYGAMGSVPHEGMSTTITEKDLAEIDSLEASWNTFWLWCAETAQFGAGDVYAPFGICNVPSNDVNLQCSLKLNDTGEVIYESPRLVPNSSVDFIKLNRTLEPGTYTVTATFRAYDRSSGILVGDGTMDDIAFIVMD